MKGLTLEVKDNIGIVTLNRPPLNTFIEETYHEFESIFKEINERDDIRVVILRAEGKRFSVGNDMQLFNIFADEEVAGNYIFNSVTNGIAQVYKTKVPVIFAGQGSVVGSAFAIACCCDFIIASEDAFFGTPEIKASIVGASGFGSLILPQKVVRYLALTGNPITAQEMKQYGAVYKVVPIENLLDSAIELANELKKRGPIILKYFKEAMQINENARLVEKYAVEGGYTMKYAKTQDFYEALKAFKEKRDPAWKGK
ncbi:MAG: enoyl-CoA hydratase-related protein [Peptostreptococcales bacterium]|jgi:enoyl-CoA hydratase